MRLKNLAKRGSDRHLVAVKMMLKKRRQKRRYGRCLFSFSIRQNEAEDSRKMTAARLHIYPCCHTQFSFHSYLALGIIVSILL